MLRLVIFRFLTKPLAAAFAFIQGAGSAAWTFPSVLGSAMLIAWAAEAAQFLISQGLALAVLAWLQTLPEFAVEAVIAWQAGQTAGDPSIAISGLTPRDAVSAPTPTAVAFFRNSRRSSGLFAVIAAPTGERGS